MKNPHIYPNQELEHAAREAGAAVKVVWEMKGPTGSEVQWLTALLINGRLVIVETFRGNGGWLAFTAQDAVDLSDLLRQCGVTDAA